MSDDFGLDTEIPCSRTPSSSELYLFIACLMTLRYLVPGHFPVVSISDDFGNIIKFAGVLERYS